MVRSVNAIISNEAHTLPADSSGNVTSFSGASSTLSIFEGSANTTGYWTLSRSNSSGVSSYISGHTIVVNGMTNDYGYVTITATRSGYSSVSKLFSLSKSKSGSTGTAGASVWPIYATDASGSSQSFSASASLPLC